MKSTQEVRRERLRKLIAERGGSLVVAKELGYKNPSFLVQMTSDNQSRNITEKTVRKFEERLNLPLGWFDSEEDAKPSARPAMKKPDLNENALGDVVVKISSILTGENISLPPVVIADITVLAYEHALSTGRVDEEYIRRIISISAPR